MWCGCCLRHDLLMRICRSINDIQRMCNFIKLLKTWESIIILSSTVQQLPHCKFPCYPDNSVCSYHGQDASGTELITGRGEKVVLIPTSFYLAIKVRMPQRHRYVFYYYKQTLQGLEIQESFLLSSWILLPSSLWFIRLQ